MTLCAHGGISKKMCCSISTYDKRNFKSQISSIFHFDPVSDSQMAHVLSVKSNFACDAVLLNIYF